MSAEDLSACGTLLGGLAAVVGVALLYFQGRKELEKWRSQKREERRAEVAGQVLGASLRALDMLQSIISPLGTVPAPIGPTKSVGDDHRRLESDRLALRSELTERWRVADSTMKDLRDAIDLALVYLPVEGSYAAAEIQLLAGEVRTNQMLWTMSGIYARPEGSDVYEKALGAKIGVRIADLRTPLLQVLSPIARLEPRTG